VESSGEIGQCSHCSPGNKVAALRLYERRSLKKRQLEQIRKRAKAGDVDSQFILAWGERLEKSRNRWLKTAAENGHPEACYWYYLATGKGHWLERSVELGWTSALHQLAVNHAWGNQGWALDQRRSRELYLQASQQGRESAWYDTGFMLLLGEGGPADPEAALAWLSKAAASNASNAEDAARLLVDLYEGGLYGVPQDQGKADYWRQNFTSGGQIFFSRSLVEQLHESGMDGFPEIHSPVFLGRVLVEYLGGTPNLDVVQELLMRGADPNVGLGEDDCFAGTTSLSWSGGRLDLVKLLVEHGARVTFESGRDSLTSVHQACRDGNLEVLKYLVERAEGAVALGHYDYILRTPLIYAAEEGHLAVVDYLLKLGVNAGLHLDETALQVALDNGHSEVVERLRVALG